jgi:hypothetical protein
MSIAEGDREGFEVATPYGSDRRRWFTRYREPEFTALLTAAGFSIRNIRRHRAYRDRLSVHATREQAGANGLQRQPLVRHRPPPDSSPPSAAGGTPSSSTPCWPRQLSTAGRSRTCLTRSPTGKLTTSGSTPCTRRSPTSVPPPAGQASRCARHARNWTSALATRRPKGSDLVSITRITPIIFVDQLDLMPGKDTYRSFIMLQSSSRDSIAHARHFFAIAPDRD